MAQNNPYSLENFLGFVQSNFSLLVIVALFFMGGFFFGSVWTENKMIKGGTANVAGTGGPIGGEQAAAPSAPSAGATDLSDANLLATAEAAGASQADMESCIASGEMATKVSGAMEAASSAGVTGTPHTVVMLDGQPVDVVAGALPITDVAAKIDGHLGGTAAVNPEAAGIPAVTSADYVKGNADARIVLVEYSDFSCPFCKQFHTTMEQVMAQYEGDVAWVYRHYPFLGPASTSAAVAAECVGEIAGPEAFWQFTDMIMS